MSFFYIPMVLGIVSPPSLDLTAASLLVLISLAILGFLELRGFHLKYSKFFNASSSSISSKVPSRVGMFLLYTPAFLVGVASFWLFPDGDLRFLLLKSAITIHFFKRIFEVSFPVSRWFSFTNTVERWLWTHLSLYLPATFKHDEEETSSADEMTRILNCSDHYQALEIPRHTKMDIAVLKKEYRKKVVQQI